MIEVVIMPIVVTVKKCIIKNANGNNYGFLK